QKAALDAAFSSKYNSNHGTAYTAMQAVFSDRHFRFTNQDHNFDLDRAVTTLVANDWGYLQSKGWTDAPSIANNFLRKGPSGPNRLPPPDKQHPDPYGYYRGLSGQF